MTDTALPLTALPKPDTAQMETLKTEARTGAVVGKVVTEAMHNGLNGPWRVFANMTAITFMLGMFWIMYRDNAASQKEDRQMFRQEIREQRESDARLREAANTELRGFAAEFRAGMTEFRGLIRDLRLAPVPHPLDGGRP